MGQQRPRGAYHRRREDIPETMYPVIANSLCARMDRTGGRAGQEQQGLREKEVNNNGRIFDDVRCRANAREFTSEGCVSKRPKLHCSNLVCFPRKCVALVNNQSISDIFPPRPMVK